MRVDEIMSRGVISLESTATVADALEIFMNKHIHHLLVIDRGRVVGVVTVRELSGKSHDVQISTIMSRKIKIATPSTSVREAAKLMLGGNAGCIPIVDGSTVVGVVTTSDLMRVLVRKAESEPRPAHDTV